MDDNDNTPRPPDVEMSGEDQHHIESLDQATDMATPQVSSNDPLYTSSEACEIPRDSILRTVISRPTEPAPTFEHSEGPEKNVLSRFFPNKAPSVKPEDAAAVKQEHTDSQPIKTELTGDGDNGIFVNQESTPSLVTTNSHLKRHLPLPELETEQAKAKRQSNSKNKTKSKNRIDPYDDEKEKQSSNLAVDKECFTNAENLSTEITKDVLRNIDALRKPGDGEREVDNLRGKIKKAGSQSERHVGNWTVGFLGDTASGKSSLINSSLNEDEVAAASDDGESGTHVIHEFAMSEPSQTTRYRAVIHFHSRKKIRSLVKQHYMNYHSFMHCLRDEIDEPEYEELRMRSNTALLFFLSLVGGPGSEPYWETVEDAQMCLNPTEIRTKEDIIDALQTAIDNYLDSFNLNKAGSIVVEANNLRELVDGKRQYTGPVKSEQGLKRSPWRLVKLINVHLSARILADGLRLADLPGLSDSDQTRVQSTRDYIKRCNTVAIVHPIARVASSDAVEKNLAYCLRAGKASNTVLVCTKTDDFNHDRDRNLSKADGETLADLRRNEQDLQAQIAELEAQKENAEDEGDDTAYIQASRALSSKSYELVIATARISSANIAFRNNAVVETMQNKFRSMQSQYSDEECDGIHIFCVSNKVYNIYRKGYDKMKPPEMTVEGTEIPLLRAHLLSEPAKMKHEKLRQACLRHLRGAVISLELYCSRSRLERKHDMLSLVQAPIAGVQSHINRAVESLKYDSTDIMLSLSESNDVQWRREANTKLNGWTTAHWRRFQGLCIKNGKGKLDKYGEDVDWNEQIFDLVNRPFVRALQKLRKAIMTQTNGLLETLDNLLLEVVVSLKGMLA